MVSESGGRDISLEEVPLLGVRHCVSFWRYTSKQNITCPQRASWVALVVKNPPANARDAGDRGSNPGLGRSPCGGNGSPLQYSCLENPVDRGTWWATARGVTESDTLKTHTHTHTHTHEGKHCDRVNWENIHL